MTASNYPAAHENGSRSKSQGADLAETDRGPAKQGDLLELLAMTETDPTGAKTFERYIWQAKQAVRQWITCLSARDGLLFIVCEHTEDIVLVYFDRFRFIQLKTKDKGSWSATVMADRGLDTLVRSYSAARVVGIHEISCFELWLEGSISDDKDTSLFVESPTNASGTVRDKLVVHGLNRENLSDFLSRLKIYPDQPTRHHIDAKVTWELSAIWPALSRPELDALYERLLVAVQAAQAAAPAAATTQRHLAAARPDIRRDLPTPDEPGGAAIEAIRSQVLSHAALVALTPPLPAESVERLLQRMSGGPGSSLLELKMTAAGATSRTIRLAQELRADMEVQRQLLLASTQSAEAELEKVAARLLAMAEATATRLAMSAAVNPAAAARPGEAIAADLLSRPADLAQCDRAQAFQGDGQLIFGYLCHLSDLCQFRWQAT